MPIDPIRNGSPSGSLDSPSSAASDVPSGDSADAASHESASGPASPTSRDDRESETATTEHVPRDKSERASTQNSEPEGEDEPVEDDGPATLGELKEPQRLHPLTLFQQLMTSLPAFAFLLYPVFSNPNSQNVVYLFMTLAYGVVALPAILLQYYRFSYRLTEKQMIIQSGVFNRKNRSIPVERVQNVQIEQNLLARAANIAKVKIETAGSTGTEGVLEYVSLREAHRIRQVIRSFQRKRVEDRPNDRASSETSEQPPDEASREERSESDVPASDDGRSVADGSASSGSASSGSADGSSPDGDTGGTSASDVDKGRNPAEHRDASDRPAVRGNSRDTRVRKQRVSGGEETKELFQMPLERVLLSGMFRFSLVYIAVVFSVFQFVEPDTLLNYVMTSRSQVQPLFDTIYDSPALAVGVTIIFASFFGWLTGILINLTRYYNFHLWLDGDKLRKRHGLFTVREGTIPIGKVQALIIRTNPLMDAFGWYALEAQTVGIDVDEQGHRVVVPFAQLEDVLEIGRRVRSFSLPDSFTSVSPLTIRRSFARYIMGLSVLVAPAVYFYPESWWHPLDVAAPYWAFALTPLLLVWAYLQYLRHGYSIGDEALYIRRGVIGRYVWVLPTEKQHVYYATASVFQRRLGLKSFFVDTAGAGSFAYPEVVDVPEDVANDALDHLYGQFDTLYENRIRAATGSADTRLSADERPQLPSEVSEGTEE